MNNREYKGKKFQIVSCFVCAADIRKDQIRLMSYGLGDRYDFNNSLLLREKETKFPDSTELCQYQLLAALYNS